MVERIYKQLDDGTKVVDVRIYYPSFHIFVLGDIIKFENTSDTNKCFFYTDDV